MDDELQDKLYEKYPNLFSNRTKSPIESCMSWGCEVGDGWYDILSSLCYSIVEYENMIQDNNIWSEKQFGEPAQKYKNYCPVKFDQVKEKYGGLRVYFSGGDDYVDGLISMAETMSYKICEMCGNVHEFVNTGLIKLVKFLENDGKFKTSRTVVEFKGVCSACTE